MHKISETLRHLKVGTKLASAIFGVCLAAGATTAIASPVVGGSLLSSSDADQLETWLGVGSQVFTNIWSGNAGVATASDFHANVDGKGPTFSIFGITLGDGSKAKIGGYTAFDWGGANGTYYRNDPNAFIFNLTTGEKQDPSQYPQYSIYVHPSYFPTFGGGHDIFAGASVLGQCNTSTTIYCDGYSNSHSYDWSQGQITIEGDSGSYNGNSGIDRGHWSVNSLEVYTFEPASAVVPLPAALPLLAGGLAILGFMGWRRKRAD